IPLHFARGQLNQRILLRPFAAFWWLLQAAVTVSVSLVLTGAWKLAPALPRDNEMPALLQLGYIFAFAYVSNLYLMCFAAAVTQSERAVHFVWRMRVVIDVVIAVAVHSVRFGHH